MKKAASFILPLLLFGLSCSKQPAPATAHPKLIYIFTIDSLRNDLIGLRYNDRLVMPNLSAFTRESVYFDNAYAQSSFTKISVSSLFTGLWPSRLGVKHCVLKVFPGGTELCRGLDSRFYTLAEDLSEIGYDTFTTFFTVHVREGEGLIQGFRHQEESLPKKLLACDKTFVYDHVLGLHAEYRPTAKALRYLSIPHHSDPDPSHVDWYWKPLDNDQGRKLYEHYLAEGYDWDLRFGELIEGLRKSTSWDDALFIVTADHGEEFLENGGTQHSVKLYNSVLRVPLFIKFPSGSPLSRHHGSRFSNRVRLVDIFPTLIHFLSQVEPHSLDGESLLPIIENTERDRDKRPALALTSIQRAHGGEQMSFESQTIVSGRFKAMWGHRIENSQLVPAFDYRRGDEIRELFDLEADPGEQSNLVSKHTDLFESLQKEYLRLSTTDLVRGSTGPRLTIPPQSEEERLDRERKLRSLGYIE